MEVMKVATQDAAVKVQVVAAGRVFEGILEVRHDRPRTLRAGTGIVGEEIAGK